MDIDYLQDDTFKQITYDKLCQLDVSQHDAFKIKKFKKFKKQEKEKFNQLKKKKNPLELKELVFKAKVNLLIKNFVRKIKRGRTHITIPQNFELKIQYEGTNLIRSCMNFLQNTQGIQLSHIMLTIWSFINIIQISIMIIIYSIMIAFPQTQNQQYFVMARVFSFILYGIDMALNFTTQRCEIGGWKKNLKEIIIFYLKNQFAPDFFSIVFFPLNSVFQASDITSIMMFIALFKLKNNIKKFQSYEFIYVKTNSREQYYSLIKVFLLNFSIGHLLSILLNLMANASENQQNWHARLGINNAPWHQKYVWGYYWGTNIMLTVGFGDLCATNKTQAGMLIFIETISCITLAYNISCVGSIIGQIKAENQQKKTKLKYFHRMCEQNKISQELSQKINNFIEESYLLKQQFEVQKYDNVINSLPKSMQAQYRKQAHKNLFGVGFFNSLNNKTLKLLAEQIIRKVAHPMQIIQKKGQIQQFYIMQKGCFGFVCKSFTKSTLNNQIIETFQIKNDNPKILSLGFIKRKQLTYDVKSLFYSVYFHLTHQQLKKILEKCDMDYQFFHYMMDRDEIVLGSNQVYKCKVCQDDYHSLFQCPQYHYVPMKQLVIKKYIEKQKISLNKRHIIERRPKSYDFSRSLQNYLEVVDGQQRFFRQYYEEDQIKQIKNIQKYYYQLQGQTNIKDHNSNLFTQKKRSSNMLLQQQYRKFQQILTKVTLNTLNFWMLQTDVAHNWSYYFKQFNTNRLINFKMYSHKRKTRQMIFGIYAHKKLPHNPAMNNVTRQIFSTFLTQNSRDRQQFNLP